MEGKKLLLIGENVSARKFARVLFVETILEEMNLKQKNYDSDSRVYPGVPNENVYGWVIDVWNAEYHRIGKMTYISIQKDYADDEKFTELEQLEASMIQKNIKTATVAKKFGI